MNNLDRITAELADMRRVAGEAMDRLADIIERKDAELAALAADVERLTAERDRYKEWCDGVAAQKVVDAVDIGTACGAMRRQNGRVIELQDAIDEIERASVKAILRPQPLKENE